MASPLKQFFAHWMKTLNLDRSGILAGMFRENDKSGICADEDGSRDDGFMSYEALQIQRYLNEVRIPVKVGQ